MGNTFLTSNYSIDYTLLHWFMFEWNCFILLYKYVFFKKAIVVLKLTLHMSLLTILV